MQTTHLPLVGKPGARAPAMATLIRRACAAALLLATIAVAACTTDRGHHEACEPGPRGDDTNCSASVADTEERGDGQGGAAGAGDAGAAAAGESLTGARLPLAGVSNADTAAFEELTGVPIRVRGAFSSTATWVNVEGTSAELEPLGDYLAKNPDATVLLSYSIYPEDTVDGVPRCAAGDYQRSYEAYGAALAAARVDGIIVRVAWEWDRWFSWGRWVHEDYDARAPVFAQCFRNVVDGMRRGHPGGRLRFDWNSTEEIEEEVLRKGYPGDGHVDVISVEAYDNKGPTSDPPARWIALKPGIDRVAAFARSRGKPTAVGEWGVTKDVTYFAGDNPHYVEQFCKWARDPANNVLYYIYFDQLMDTGEDYRLASYPLSLAAFRKYCVGATRATLP